MGSANGLNTPGGQQVAVRACLVAAICITGCQSFHSPRESWAEVNPLQTTAETDTQTGLHSASAVSKKLPATDSHNALAAKKVQRQRATYWSIRQVVTEFIPASYRVDTGDGIDLDAVIQIEPSENWLEALGAGMSLANIELITNITRKTLFLRRKKIALAEVIEKLLPDDFTVFSDADINLQTLIHFDRRENWVQAFNHGTAESDIDLTIDFTNKIIALKPKNRRNAHFAAATAND